LSLRRYKQGVYAFPYEGEQVKLHWANADQYYTETTEGLCDYRFRLADERYVHFRPFLLTQRGTTTRHRTAKYDASC
jgi:adenine-specific DNA-methyltransferase